jgi:hypothetical protein
MAHPEDALTSEWLTYWTEALTGLDPERVTAARQTVAGWEFDHVSRELLDDSVDAAVAAVLLVEGIEALDQRGVDYKRIRKKLRNDPAVWGTWAEVRAASALLYWAGPDAELRLEEGRSKGAHADFRILLPEDEVATSVEVKAVGLSDDDVAFCQRMAPSLPRLVPKIGLGHIHAPMNAAPPELSRAERRARERDARKKARHVPYYPTGLRGAAIVGHGSEERYANRVAKRVEQAVRQLPTDDECWVAILWSNGAPLREVANTIRWDDIPRHVRGILLVGSGVAFPHRNIHVFVMPVERDRDADADIELQTLNAEEGMQELAALILGHFERSSGVRATLLYGGARELVRRDGNKRILPFNLMLDPDPVQFDREAGGFWERLGAADPSR